MKFLVKINITKIFLWFFQTVNKLMPGTIPNIFKISICYPYTHSVEEKKIENFSSLHFFRFFQFFFAWLEFFLSLQTRDFPHFILIISGINWSIYLSKKMCFSCDTKKKKNWRKFLSSSLMWLSLRLRAHGMRMIVNILVVAVFMDVGEFFNGNS